MVRPTLFAAGMSRRKSRHVIDPAVHDNPAAGRTAILANLCHGYLPGHRI